MQIVRQACRQVGRYPSTLSPSTIVDSMGWGVVDDGLWGMGQRFGLQGFVRSVEGL